MNEITTVGVDLAKDVIVVCAADAAGRTVFFKQLGFRGFAEWAANLLPCTIAMEACSSAHYWARTLSALGHRPKLLAPDLVQPFRKSKGTKNDRNDAQAVLIAALQPDMRFVSVKTLEQQSILACHRMREGWKVERTALINRDDMVRRNGFDRFSWRPVRPIKDIPPYAEVRE
jgi:transposase